MATYAKTGMRLLILVTLALAVMVLSKPTTVRADAECCVQNCDGPFNQCEAACHTLPRNEEIGCFDVCVQNLNDCHDSCGGCL